MTDVVLLRVPVDEDPGDFIEVQVTRSDLAGLEDDGVVLAANDGERFKAVAFSLASAADHVVPALRTMVGRLRDGVHAPDEVTLGIGLQIGGETGFVFAKGTAEASIAVTMTWRRLEDKDTGAGPDGKTGGREPGRAQPPVPHEC